MGECQIRMLFRPFDPTSSEAEERYDGVVRKLNRVRARHRLLARELDRIVRQLAEEDLELESSPHRRPPSTIARRRRRLERVIELGCLLERLGAEERFAAQTLDRMNAALDRWARETWGG